MVDGAVAGKHETEVAQLRAERERARDAKVEPHNGVVRERVVGERAQWVVARAVGIAAVE